MPTWMVRAGRQGEFESLALEKDIACVGWSDLPDMTPLKSRDAMTKALKVAYPGKSESTIRNYVSQVFPFAHLMNEGDVVVMPLKTKGVLAIGRVTGPYSYRSDLGDVHHTRPVHWLRTDVLRSSVRQDLLYTLGAFMTVCRVSRNEADRRVAALLDGKSDPGWDKPEEPEKESPESLPDLEQMGRDQIMAHVQAHFQRHDLARLVDALLQTEGYVTRLSPPGPDGGVDILARKGLVGFEGPCLCVQVKSSQTAADVTILRSLKGTMSDFKADQGLLVSWGGFNSAVEKEAKLSFFSVRLWSAKDVVEAVLRNYAGLPEELQNELPLKRIWTLVPEDSSS